MDDRPGQDRPETWHTMIPGLPGVREISQFLRCFLYLFFFLGVLGFLCCLCQFGHTEVWAYRSLGIHQTERHWFQRNSRSNFSLDGYFFGFLGLFFRCSGFLFWVSAVDIQGYTCSRGKVLLYGFPEKVVLSLYLGDRSKPYILLYSQMLCRETSQKSLLYTSSEMFKCHIIPC